MGANDSKSERASYPMTEAFGTAPRLWRACLADDTCADDDDDDLAPAAPAATEAGEEDEGEEDEGEEEKTESDKPDDAGLQDVGGSYCAVAPYAQSPPLYSHVTNGRK